MRLIFSNAYPEKPPRVRFTSEVFHPNGTLLLFSLPPPLYRAIHAYMYVPIRSCMYRLSSVVGILVWQKDGPLNAIPWHNASIGLVRKEKRQNRKSRKGGRMTPEGCCQ